MNKISRFIMPTPEEEIAIQRGIDADPDTHELSDEELDGMRPCSEWPAFSSLRADSKSPEH
ncbi:MAG: hypothetical protein ACRYG5_13280 [Janthinobacterium lividum]